MIRRTTVELDYDLVDRAQAVLHCATVRATIHEALRRAIDGAEDAGDAKPPRGSPAAVLRYLQSLSEDQVEVLRSNEMWR